MTIFLKNQGPGPVSVIDAAGLLHSLGNQASKEFEEPLQVLGAGGAPAEFVPEAPPPAPPTDTNPPAEPALTPEGAPA